MIPSLFFKIIFLFLCMHVHAPVYLCVLFSCLGRAEENFGSFGAEVTGG